MFQIESPGIGNHGVAEAAGFQRCKGIFFAPHPVDFIEILGADGRIRFAPDVSLRFHEIKDIIIVTLDRFPVFPDTVTLRKLKVFRLSERNQSLLLCKSDLHHKIEPTPKS